MTEKEFTDFIEERLGGSSNTDIDNELPEEIYVELLPNYKKIYQDKMYEYGIYISQSKNKSLIQNLIKRDFNKFESAVLRWVKHFIDDIEHYAEYYNEQMSDYFSIEFILTVKENTQIFSLCDEFGFIFRKK